MFKNFRKNKYNSGFTLIELLVVVFIFMITTLITVFSYGKFNSSISIQNLADDIALSVRKAQSYAIGVRGMSGSGSFNDGYGIHFSTDPASSVYAGSNKSFILFSDLNIDNLYKYNYDGTPKCGDPTTTNECIEVLNIISNDQITEIKLNDESNPRSITGQGSQGTIDILFKRPNPEPKFCYRSSAGQADCDTESSPITKTKIKISNITNPEIYKIVTISNNGQISVSNNEN